MDELPPVTVERTGQRDGLDEAAAPANEFRHGRTSLAVDALPGAARFVAGAGRHGERVQP